MNQNFYNSNSYSFDQFQPPQYPVVLQPPEEKSIEELKTMMQSYYKIMSQRREQEAILLQDEEKQELLVEEHAANPSEPSPVSYFYNADYDNISTSSTTYTIHLIKSATIITNHSELIRRIYHNHDIFYDGDDDEELLSDEIKRIQKILERTSFDAITPDFPITDSLSMGDEHLSTIPETESDELIKSSVENLVPTQVSPRIYPISKVSVMCLVCDDFTTVSNPLFDADNDFSSSDDKSFSDEDVSKEIYSNPLFDEDIISTKIDPHYFNAESDLTESLLNRDTLIISSPKFDSLLEEFSGELAHIDLIPPRINEGDFYPEEDIHLVERLLYDNSSPRPPKEFNSENSDAIIESFSPSPIPVEDSDSLMEEINLFLTPDDSMPPGIENDDYDSERDILFIEELLSNDSHSLPANESFHFNVPSSPRPPAKPPDDGIYFEPDTEFLIAKVVDDISDNSTRELYVHVPNVLPNLPTLCPVIFYPPNPPFVQIAPDYEASRARGFVLCSLELQHPQLHYGNPISNLIDKPLSLSILNKRI
ncbi:hypothetical protein Tco_0656545 [Tanacetum coccineum]|uniref:Uncharacterized protein n=1 Tax=Tanacetum coccineum TaxID=301880 RepID=A0ABQ4X998_9ASTR